MPTKNEITHAFVVEYPDKRRQWAGKCQAAMWNLCDLLGRPSAVSSSATVARLRSRIQGAGIGPGQNFVYWSGVMVRDENTGVRYDAGHVAYHLGGGLLFMASGWVTEKIATSLGYITADRYQKITGFKLEGWSYDNAGATVPREPLANTHTPPVTLDEHRVDVATYLANRKADTMQLILHRKGNDAQTYVHTELGGVFEQSAAIPDYIVMRLAGQKSDADVPVFSNEEIQMIDILAEQTRRTVFGRARTEGLIE